MEAIKHTFGAKSFRNKKQQKVINEYTVIGKLGEGAYSRVFLVRCRKKEYAMKIVNSEYLARKKIFTQGNQNGLSGRSMLDDVLNEIRINSKLAHENVVKIFEVINDEEKGKIYIVMEYCAKGSFLSWNPTTSTFHALWSKFELNEGVIKHIFRQLVFAVYYLHSNFIVHFDLKPQNVLICEDFTVKLSDFDQACELLSARFIARQPATLQFFPPESLSGVEYAGSLGAKAIDIWGLGIILYAAIFGVLPFSGGSMDELFENIEKKELSFDGKVLSGSLRNLIGKMLDKNPNSRITINEIVKDVWFTDNTDF